ncbi:MAG: slipin family protein [Dehalococcoidia bacterium]|nr:slipin family protein [Dehalococcoidia bacterium]
MDWWIPIIIVLVLILILLPASIKIVYQYEAGVVFRLGRLVKTRAPGIRFIIPFIDRMRKVDTRVITMDVPSQEAITRDNVTLKVNAVVYFRVMHPEAAVVEVYDYKMATYQIAQTTLRSVLGQSELDDLLARRDKINQQLQQIIDEQTEPWGIKVSVVEVKDVELPISMQRAMAAQAEAEREKRAKLIHAEGELQASEKLAEAGVIVGKEPATLQLRYLQTLVTIATEKSQIMVFPVPMDLLSAFMPKKE